MVLFYQNSNLVIAIFLTTVFVGYLFFIITGKSVDFELTDSSIKSLGTSFGFNLEDIIGFLAARTNEMIKSYINFNQVWDMLFGLIYGLMYVVWVSVLFKPLSQKAGRLNLVPFLQVIFDWLENYQLVLLSKQYLADGMISMSNAQLASVFSVIKWGCSGLTYILIFTGIVLMVMRVLLNKN